ncbi:MAG: hypothetical protein Q7S51_03255 [Gallionellaceae bacterium]|nr:hypothetical protein [Gallionellaceae bacterium]
MPKLFITLALLAVSYTLYAGEEKWEGKYGSADQACRAKVEEGGTSAFQHSHAEVHGDVARCYIKPKDSDNKTPPDYVTAVYLLEKPEAEESAEGEQPANSDSDVSKTAEDGSAAQQADICQQVISTFNETLANELPPSKTNGATIAVGVITTADAIQSWVAAASSIIGAGGNFTVSVIGKPSTSKYDYYAQGVRLNEASNVRACNTNQQFVYPNNPARPLQGHAESKIIEDWFKSGASSNSTLYLKIGGAQTQPCPNCGNLIQFVNSGGTNCPKIKLCP